MFCDTAECYFKPEGFFLQTCSNENIGGILPGLVFCDTKQMPPSASFHSTVSGLFSYSGVVLLCNRTCHSALISIKFHNIRATARRGWHKLIQIQFCMYTAFLQERKGSFKKECMEWVRYVQFGLSIPKMTHYTCMPPQWNRACWLDFYYFISMIWYDVMTPPILESD